MGDAGEAHDEEVCFSAAGFEVGGGLEQVGDTLVIGEEAEVDDERPCGGNAELGAEGLFGLGRAQRRVEAAHIHTIGQGVKPFGGHAKPIAQEGVGLAGAGEDGLRPMVDKPLNLPHEPLQFPVRP